MFWRLVLRLDMDFAGIFNKINSPTHLITILIGPEFQTHVIISKENLQAILDVVTKDLYALNALGPHLTTRKPISRLAREEANLHLDPRTKLVLELASEVLIRITPHKPSSQLRRSSSNSSITVPLSPDPIISTKSDVKTEPTTSPEPPVAKRRRVSLGPKASGDNLSGDLWDLVLSEVCAEKAASPNIHTFTQLLWVLATQYRRYFASDVETDCITSVVSALERVKDRADTEVWLLRVLEALATYSPQSTTLSSAWGSAWNSAVRRTHAQHPIADRALHVLRAIVRMVARGYTASSPPLFPFSLREVWKAPVFEEENGPQTQHMATLCAALELLVDTAGMVKAEDRERMLKWLMDITEYLSRLEYTVLTSAGITLYIFL